MEHLTGTLSKTGTLSGSVNFLKDFVTSWVKIGESELQVSTTNSQPVLQTTIQVNNVWTDADIIYVRIRDKAGKRAGYFLGTDTFFINFKAANGDDSELNYAGRIINKYNGTYEQSIGNTYGVYPYSISPNGSVKIYSRYEIGYSRRINGTYKIEIFKLRYPDLISPFDI